MDSQSIGCFVKGNLRAAQTMPHRWSGLCCCELDARSRNQKLRRRHRRLAHTTPRDTALGNILGHSGWTRTTPTQIAPPLGDTERIDRSGPSVRTRSTLPVQFARFTFKYGHKYCIDTSSQHAPWEALVFSWLGTCMNNKHPTILSLPQWTCRLCKSGGDVVGWAATVVRTLPNDRKARQSHGPCCYDGPMPTAMAARKLSAQMLEESGSYSYQPPKTLESSSFCSSKQQ